jgi:peptidoglycan/xylan/chitin deacetylase (PgdA/CDA1 family)
VRAPKVVRTGGGGNAQDEIGGKVRYERAIMEIANYLRTGAAAARAGFTGALLGAATVFALAAAIVAGLSPAAAAGDGGVVLMYHRFGESDLPSTNIRLEQFEAHLAELQSGGYTVMPLDDMVRAWRAGTPLPDRAVAITIDDAFRSIYTHAWPRLRAAGFPFTVFVATDPVDQRNPNYMTWDQLRELTAAGVAIGNHTDSHLRLQNASPAAAAAAIAAGQERIREELGLVPSLLAYPFGEASLAARQLVIDAGFDAAFGQHSGVAFAAHDQFYLPRFSFNEAFASMDRFRLAANALPLPVDQITPADPLLAINPPPFGFTLTQDVANLGRLNCFASHESGPALIERLGERRIEVRMATPFPAGRGRINCTVPAEDGRWRWFGFQYTIRP